MKRTSSLVSPNTPAKKARTNSCLSACVRINGKKYILADDTHAESGSILEIELTDIADDLIDTGIALLKDIMSFGANVCTYESINGMSILIAMKVFNETRKNRAFETHICYTTSKHIESVNSFFTHERDRVIRMMAHSVRYYPLFTEFFEVLLGVYEDDVSYHDPGFEVILNNKVLPDGFKRIFISYLIEKLIERITIDNALMVIFDKKGEHLDNTGYEFINDIQKVINTLGLSLTPSLNMIVTTGEPDTATKARIVYEEMDLIYTTKNGLHHIYMSMFDKATKIRPGLKTMTDQTIFVEVNGDVFVYVKYMISSYLADKMITLSKTSPLIRRGKGSFQTSEEVLNPENNYLKANLYTFSSNTQTLIMHDIVEL